VLRRARSRPLLDRADRAVLAALARLLPAARGCMVTGSAHPRSAGSNGGSYDTTHSPEHDQQRGPCPGQGCPVVHTDGPLPEPAVLGLSALTGAAQQGYLPLQQTEQRSAIQNY
jgi:hypothetical protein